MRNLNWTWHRISISVVRHLRGCESIIGRTEGIHIRGVPRLQASPATGGVGAKTETGPEHPGDRSRHNTGRGVWHDIRGADVRLRKQAGLPGQPEQAGTRGLAEHAWRGGMSNVAAAE